MEHSKNSVKLVIQGQNGQQQLIKIMRNPNGQPLTQEGVSAIVKEVTGQEVLSSKTININRQTVVVSSTNALMNEIITSDPTPTKPTATTTKTGSATFQSSSGKQMKVKFTKQCAASIKAQAEASMTAIIKMEADGSSSTSSHLSPSISTNKKSSSIAGSGGGGSGATGSNHGVQQNTIVRRRKVERVGKGLRHFSMKVCEKVKEKGTTTYNEVADELVAEEVKGQPIEPANYDEKNIRRRVYDALNVLMAMNIISKYKKEIKWIGLPTNSAQQCKNLEKENQLRKDRIEAKQQQLRELILQQVSFKSLVTRNKESEDRGLVPSPSSAIQMPFIIVNTHKKTNVNCSISNDKSEYHFKFDDKFEIHDDIEVLKRMGLLLGLDKGECTFDDIERAKTMVPKSFEKYIELYGKGQEETLSNDWDMSIDPIGLVPKHEQVSDDDDMDDQYNTDGSDIE